jgi:hypothetical protein
MIGKNKRNKNNPEARGVSPEKEKLKKNNIFTVEQEDKGILDGKKTAEVSFSENEKKVITEKIAKETAVIGDNQSGPTNGETGNLEKKELSEIMPVFSVIKNYSAWQAVGESLVGMAHRRGAVPVVCQDAYCLSNTKRLILAVCDGAGSAVMSEIGSFYLSQSIIRLVGSLEVIINEMLDSDANQKFGNKLAQIIYEYSIKLLQDIAVNNKRDVKDFRTTLLLVVAGIKNAFWLRVGDGEIVVEENGYLRRIGTSLKGEYSNETVFIDENLKDKDVQYGLFGIDSVSGLAVMSDGASERLVSTDGTKIADRLTAFFDMLKNSKLPRETLYKFFTNYDDWKGSTHDDKTIVLAARKEIS